MPLDGTNHGPQGPKAKLQHLLGVVERAETVNLNRFWSPELDMRPCPEGCIAALAYCDATFQAQGLRVNVDEHWADPLYRFLGLPRDVAPVLFSGAVTLDGKKEAIGRLRDVIAMVDCYERVQS